MRTGHLTLRESLRKPDVGVIIHTHHQICAQECAGLSWQSYWQPAEHNIKLQDTTNSFALASRCNRAVDAMTGFSPNNHRNTDLDLFQTHQRPSSLYIRHRFFSTAGAASITSDPKTHVIRAAAAWSDARSATSGTMAGRTALLASNRIINV